MIGYYVFNRLIHQLTDSNVNSNIHFFPHLVGKISHVPSIRMKFNLRRRQTKFTSILGPFNAMKRIYTILNSKRFADKSYYVVAVLLSFNGINNNNNNGHASIGVFKVFKGVIEGYQVYSFNILFIFLIVHFFLVFNYEPASERKSYFTVVSTLTSMTRWLTKKTRKGFDIMRAYGNQKSGVNCFRLCLDYLCQISDGFNFEDELVWKSDKEERRNKLHR